MPLSSEDESHGLRRESHPKRVAFLLPTNIFSGVQAESQSLRTLIALCCGCGSRGRAADLKISTSAHQPRKKKPPELRPQRLFDFNQDNQIAVRSGTVHVHLLPATTKLLPDPCFAAAGRHGISFHQLPREICLLDSSFFDLLFQFVGRIAGSVVRLRHVGVTPRAHF